MYLQFEPVEGPSSSLIELGIALGKQIKTTIILKNGLPEPRIFDGFQAVAAKLKFLPQARIYHVENVEAACSLIEIEGRKMLGLQ